MAEVDKLPNVPVSRFSSLAVAGLLVLVSGCRRGAFPEYPANYREFAYVSNGAANTVSVLDLVYVRQDKVLQVGQSPSGIAVNPKRNEVYVANAGSGTVTVINTELNRIEATIGVQKQPYSIAVSPDGKRAYTANSGSNTVSVIDLDTRKQIAAIGTGVKPGVVAVAPDNRSVVVTNRGSDSLSIYSVPAKTEDRPALKLRSTFGHCQGVTEAVILPDSTKVFAACSGSKQLLAVWLAADPNEWRGKQDPSLQQDAMLAMLDVGDTPVHLTLKPDGGEVFVSNFGSNTISEVSTYTNEVSSTFSIGSQPVHSVISRDGSYLWVSNFGSDSLGLYSIDDGKRINSLRTGTAPDALAFSADEHLLLAANAKSGDIAVIRTAGRTGQPELFTMLPTGASPNAIAVKAFTVK